MDMRIFMPGSESGVIDQNVKNGLKEATDRKVGRNLGKDKQRTGVTAMHTDKSISKYI
jgi:hypothetical protein